MARMDKQADHWKEKVLWPAATYNIRHLSFNSELSKAFRSSYWQARNMEQTGCNAECSLLQEGPHSKSK